MADPLHERACELAPAEREAFLRRECGDDASLRALVDELLAGDAAAENLEELLSVPESWQPECIGRYRILERIGAGGMWVVYSAEQENPRRVVAVKVVHPGFVDDELLRRFEHETSTLGWLNHPCIAQVYDAGTVEGAQPVPAEADDRFGISVAFSGDTFVVGAEGESSGTAGGEADNGTPSAGAVYLGR